MRLKIFLITTLMSVGSLNGDDTLESIKSKRGIFNGYYGNIYRYVDSTPAATQYYNPRYIQTVPRLQEPKVSTQSQVLYEYQQTPQTTLSNVHLNQQFNHPQSTQQVAYTQYVQTPSQTRYLPLPAETVVTPVQHSTIIQHTPYTPSVPTQSNPYALARYLQLNGNKMIYPQIQMLPLQQHPLQKPVHYPQPAQQQKFIPSTQYYPNTNLFSQNQQEQFVPIRNPVQPAQINQNTEHDGNAKQAPEEQNEEAAEEEAEDDEKGEINEEDEEDEEEENGRYQESDEDEDEEEEKPKYRLNSYHAQSNNDDDEEEDERAGYRTHEDVEEDDEDEEDSNEGSSHVSYNKKTPRNYLKFDKRPPINKTKSKPVNKTNYEQYTFSRGHNGKPKIDGIQGRPSQNVPVTVQKVYKEKWYITRKE